MDSPTHAACPLCLSDVASGAAVCASCGRDIAPPSELLAERDALLAKREELTAAIAAIQMRIAHRRSRKT